MINQNEDALICDLAETYHIYDYRQLPPLTVAVFSCGLRDDSRIKMELNDQTVSIDTLLIAGISDKLGLLLWSKTKDGQLNKNRPVSILESLVSTPKEKNELVFDSGEDFERMRTKLIEEGRKSNGN